MEDIYEFLISISLIIILTIGLSIFFMGYREVNKSIIKIQDQVESVKEIKIK